MSSSVYVIDDSLDDKDSQFLVPESQSRKRAGSRVSLIGNEPGGDFVDSASLQVKRRCGERISGRQSPVRQRVSPAANLSSKTNSQSVGEAQIIDRSKHDNGHESLATDVGTPSRQIDDDDLYLRFRRAYPRYQGHWKQFFTLCRSIVYPKKDFLVYTFFKDDYIIRFKDYSTRFLYNAKNGDFSAHILYDEWFASTIRAAKYNKGVLDDKNIKAYISSKERAYAVPPYNEEAPPGSWQARTGYKNLTEGPPNDGDLYTRFCEVYPSYSGSRTQFIWQCCSLVPLSGTIFATSLAYDDYLHNYEKGYIPYCEETLMCGLNPELKYHEWYNANVNGVMYRENIVNKERCSAFVDANTDLIEITD